MGTVTVFDQSKKEVGSLDLSPEIFEVEVRPEIMHLVVRAQLAAKRVGTHSTKTRAFVSGGGKKPWKPLPLLVPVTFTFSPGWKMSTVMSWPTT